MASPKIEVIWFYDASGNPLTGLTPTLITYKRDDGTNVSPPTVTEIGGGAYKFTPVFTTDIGLIYVLDGGASAFPRYATRYMRPEDYNSDGIPDIKADTQRIKLLKEGRWKIFSTGPDANRLVLYSSDGVTVLQKWDLKDLAGSGTISNVYERVPVSSIP